MNKVNGTGAIKSAPYYFQYFTQAYECPHFNLDWIADEDLQWIDELNVIASAEKSERVKQDIAAGRDPNKSMFTSEDVLSKDFSSTNFPSFYDWPEEFRKKYEASRDATRQTIKELAKTAQRVVKADDITIYVDCKDGNHYFSTPYFEHGDIKLAEVQTDKSNDHEFDSVDTAVYAFINDFEEWERKHGAKSRIAQKIQELEALRTPSTYRESHNGCEHEDLGSFGYTHGSIVNCPYCGANAEVW